ncbi:trypsin-like serine protease [Kitasatospora sp. NPDC057904]|uniref:trypsin-like serine protease n=1 Tax=unclassified Kitasatospora TaxID=2633591 RepID=UPI0036DE7D4B
MSGTTPRTARMTALAAAVAAGAFAVIPAAPAGAVVGGAAGDGAYGYTAKLAIGDGLRACTGALVDRYWVVTAASCFAENPAQPAALQAGAPTWKTTATVSGKAADVVELAPRTDRDLVMARLSSPVDGVTPLALATAAPAAGQTLRVPGFGRTKDEWVPGTMHTGVFSLDSVQAAGIAVTGQGGAAICKGDTGAPAIRETNGKAELVAVASRSWQGGCLGETETRTGATAERVDDLAGWVKDLRYRTADVKSGTHVQIIGADNTLWDTVADYEAGSWLKNWSPVGSPAVVSAASAVTGDTVHAYAIGTDGKVYNHDGKVGGAWTKWGEVPGFAAGAKAVTAVARGNTVDVMIIGSDDKLYSTTADYAAGQWSGRWNLIDGRRLKAVTSSASNNVVHVFGIGEDGKVHTIEADYNAGRWTTWGEVPNGAAGAKAITASARGNTTDLMIIGSDGSLYSTTADYAAGSWGNRWNKIWDNRLKAVTSSAEGNVVHVFAINEDDKVYNLDADYNAGQWSKWGEVPGGAAGAKAITATTTG